MNITEAEEYFDNFRIQLRFMKNHIDYENIDNPIQSIDGTNIDFRLTVTGKISNDIALQTHIFSDNISRLQLLGGESVTEFLNLDT